MTAKTGVTPAKDSTPPVSPVPEPALAAGEPGRERQQPDQPEPGDLPEPPGEPAGPDWQRPARQSATTYTDAGDGWLTGNLCRSPELRFSNSGQPIALLRLAETPRYKDDQTGEWFNGDTEYYDVQVWRRQAENVVESLGTGDRVIAAGRWQLQEWTTGEGVRKQRRVLVARDIGPSLQWRQAKLINTRGGHRT